MPHDPIGWSILLQEHYLEHQQFVALFQAQAIPVFIPDYNFAVWDDDKKVVASWLEAHQTTHLALRNFTGVSGIDLSDVDFTQDDQFLGWLDDHAAEHSDLRRAMGITT